MNMEVSTTILLARGKAEGCLVLLKSLLGTTTLDLSTCLTTEDEAEEIRWYHENHALQDPFSLDRAASVVGILERQCRALTKCLENELRRLKNTISDLQVVEVLIDSELASKNIHWEALEASDAWSKDMPLVIRVCRYVQSRTTISRGNFVVKRMESINILFLSARPAYRDDVPYRLISKPLWQMIQNSSELRGRVRLNFVRPGTWSALKRVLKKYPAGHFRIAHFDVHGGWKEAKQRSSGMRAPFVNGICFTSPNSSKQKPDFRSATDVGNLLAQFQIPTAIFNACNTSSTHTMHEQGGQHLAATLCEHGVLNVVAMSYAVLADTANSLMLTLYQELLSSRSTLLEATASARYHTAKYTTRMARFGMTVAVNDSLVLVLHRSLSQDDITRSLSVHKQKTAIAVRKSDSRQILGTSQIGEELQGRDGDLLALEAAFSEVNCINLVASGGSGKTALARYATNWWLESGFIDEMVKFDLYTEPDLFRTDGGIFFRICPDTSLDKAILSVRSRRIMIVIDNWECDVLDKRWTGADAHNFIHFLDYANEESSRCLVFLISSSPPQFLDNVGLRTVELRPLDLQDSLQVAAKLMVGAGRNYRPDAFSSQYLEQMLEKHSNNMLFCSLFMSMVEDVASVKQLSQNLLLDLPPKTAEALENYITKQMPPYSWTLSAFEQAFESIRGRGEATMFILLSLAPFTGAYSRVLYFYVSKLRERELIHDSKITFSNLTNLPVLEAHEFRCSTLETLNAAVESDPLYQEYFSVRNTLASFGLVKARSSNLDGEIAVQLEIDIPHPLLPYLIRHKLHQFEASRPDLTSITGVKQLCDVMFWEHFEARALNVIQGTGLTPAMMYVMVENEWDNFRKATELCLCQPQYGQRPMALIALVEILSAPYFLRIQSRRSDVLDLTNTILSRYRDLQRSNTSMSTRYFMIVQTLVTVQARMECLSLLGDEDGASSLVTTGGCLIQGLPESFIHEDDYVKSTEIYFDILKLLVKLKVWSIHPPIQETRQMLVAARQVTVTSQLAAKVLLGLVQCLTLIALDTDYRNAFIEGLGRKVLIDETDAVFSLWPQICSSTTFRLNDFSQLNALMKTRKSFLDLAWTLESVDDDPDFDRAWDTCVAMFRNVIHIDRALSIALVDEQSSSESTADLSKSLLVMENFSQARNISGQIKQLEKLFMGSIKLGNLQTALSQEGRIHELENALADNESDMTKRASIRPERLVLLADLMLKRDKSIYNSDFGENMNLERRESLEVARSLSLEAINATEWLPQPLNFSNLFALEFGTYKLADIESRLGSYGGFCVYSALSSRLLLTREIPSDSRPGVWKRDVAPRNAMFDGELIYRFMQYLKVGTFLGSRTICFKSCRAWMGPGAAEQEDLDDPTQNTSYSHSTEDVAPSFCVRFPWWNPSMLSAFIGNLSMLQFIGDTWPRGHDFENLPSHARTVLEEAEKCLIFPPGHEMLSTLTIWSPVSVDHEDTSAIFYRFTPENTDFWQEARNREEPVYMMMLDGEAWSVYENMRLEEVQCADDSDVDEVCPEHHTDS